MKSRFSGRATTIASLATYVPPRVLTNADLEKIRAISELLDGAFRTTTLDCTWPASEGAEGLEKAVDRICREATESVLADNNILILCDRTVSADELLEIARTRR